MTHKLGFLSIPGGLAAAGLTILAIGATWIALPKAPPAPGCGDCNTTEQAGGSGLTLEALRKGSWCNTVEMDRFIGEPIGFVTDAPCPLMGPPDDPAVRNASIPTAETPLKTVRLMFHIFRENNGSNAAATTDHVVYAMGVVNERFAPWRFQFQYQVRFVNDSRYRYLESNEEYQMKRQYALSPATQINVFVTDTGGGSHGTFPWNSSALTAQGGIVQHNAGLNGIAYPTVLPHEIGHNLGLWHTFHGVTEVAQCGDCYEPVGRDAATGDTTGDFCSDTNPTNNHGACADPNAIDPCTGGAFTATPWNNVMSYGLRCANEFTPHQAGRMHAWTEYRLTGWLVLPGPPTVPGAPSLSKSGSIVTVVWADNSNDEDTFDVQRETKSGSTWVNQTIVATVGANITSITDAPGAGTHRYRVRAANSYGASAWSSWTQIKL